MQWGYSLNTPPLRSCELSRKEWWEGNGQADLLRTAKRSVPTGRVLSQILQFSTFSSWHFCPLSPTAPGQWRWEAVVAAVVSGFAEEKVSLLLL